MYKAKNKITNEECAVKIILKRNLNNQEIEIMKMIKHPNIIKLLDHYEEDDYHYIFLELCNCSLFDLMTNRKYLIDSEKICYIVKNILLGIEYLQTKNIAHRYYFILTSFLINN